MLKLILYTDGGSRENPGLSVAAACLCLVKDVDVPFVNSNGDDLNALLCFRRAGRVLSILSHVEEFSSGFVRATRLSLRRRV